MDFEQVQGWVKANAKDPKVMEFLSTLVPKAEVGQDQVKEYLDTQEGQKVLQPYVDRKLDQAIKTYRENHFTQEVKSQVAAEMLKLNPQETPEQRRLRELEDKLSQSEKDREKDRLKRQLVEEASRMGVDAFFVEDYLPATLDEGKLYLSKLQQYVQGRESKKANEVLASGSFKPGAGGAPTIDPSKMPPKERQAFYEAQAEKRWGSGES